MRVGAEELRALVHSVFEAAGCDSQEAGCISDHLLEANLAGHDSHGVILIPTYMEYLREGSVRANQKLRLIVDEERFLLADGQRGFGQSIGQQAMQLGIEKVEQQGVAIVALRNSGHLGRIGYWAEMAARANKISIHFVNSSGAGLGIAPVGGISPTLSVNPIAMGVPVDAGKSIVLDISTSAIAAGKVQVAFHKGVTVPDGCITDASGRPTNDPKVLFSEPMGVLLPFGGHKGYGLSLIAELLAGALTGGGCSRPGVTQLEQGMLTILIDPSRLVDLEYFSNEISRFVAFVKSSKKIDPETEILVAGEMEERQRIKRRAEGIELDETTRGELLGVCRSLKVGCSPIEKALNSKF